MISRPQEPESELVAQARQRIVDAVHPMRVVLFGSAAKGCMGPNSDFDVLVVVGNEVSRRAATQAIYRSLFGFSVATDVVVVTENDVARYASSPGLIIGEALREGREIYRAA